MAQKSFMLHYVLPAIVLGVILGVAKLKTDDDEARSPDPTPAAPVVAAPTAAPPAATPPPPDTDDGKPYTDEMRKGVAINLTKLMRDEGAEVAFQSDGTVLLVLNLEGGGCDRAGLREFAKLVGAEQLKRAGFTKVKCSPRGGEIPVK